MKIYEELRVLRQDTDKLALQLESLRLAVIIIEEYIRSQGQKTKFEQFKRDYLRTMAEEAKPPEPPKEPKPVTGLHAKPKPADAPQDSPYQKDQNAQKENVSSG